MIRSASPLKQIQYASKLKMIDSHIIKTQLNPSISNSEYQQMLRIMALKLALEPPQEIIPFTAKTIIFDTFETRNFVIKQQMAPKGKNFILNVSTYVQIRLEVKINDRPPKIYSFQGNKAIQIYQSSFTQVLIAATVQKVGIFSSVKFYLDLIQIQYTSPKKTTINLRPNIDKQLQEFLINNRGKSAEILRNRSLLRSKQLLMRKTTNDFKPPIKNLELVRSKSEYQTFQRKKSLYIKHVRKMSPSKVKILQEHEEKYHTTKKQQMARLIALIYTSKLGMIIQQNRVKQSKLRIRQMKITMLCSDFIKIIKNKFRLKMTEKARLRMTIHHTLQFLPVVMRNGSIQNAKKVLLQALTPYMNYRTIQQLGANSEEYFTSLIKIQRYMKLKVNNIRERVRLLIQILIKQVKIPQPIKNINKIIEKYIQICKNKGRWCTNIYQCKQQLIDLLWKNDL